VLLYKYAAIFLITVLGALALPIPSGSVLIISFFFATQGYLDFFWVATVGFAGNLVVDLFEFWIARLYGRKMLTRVGLGWLLNARAVSAIESKLAKYPISTIFLTRFITTVTPLVNVMVGLTRVSFITYLVIDVIGQLGEVAVNFILGVTFGENWAYFDSIFDYLLVIGLAVLALLLVLLVHRRNGRPQAAHR